MARKRWVTRAFLPDQMIEQSKVPLTQQKKVATETSIQALLDKLPEKIRYEGQWQLNYYKWKHTGFGLERELELVFFVEEDENE